MEFQQRNRTEEGKKFSHDAVCVLAEQESFNMEGIKLGLLCLFVSAKPVREANRSKVKPDQLAPCRAHSATEQLGYS